LITGQGGNDCDHQWQGCILCERKGFWFNPGFDSQADAHGTPGLLIMIPPTYINLLRLGSTGARKGPGATPALSVGTPSSGRLDQPPVIEVEGRQHLEDAPVEQDVTRSILDEYWSPYAVILGAIR
jgi:hypothetical protein